MRLEYTLTFEDWREGMAPRNPDGTPRRSRKGGLRALFAWLTFLGVLSLSFYLSTIRPPTAGISPPIQQNPPQDLLPELLPMASMCFFLIWAILLGKLAAIQKRQTAIYATLGRVLGGFMGLAIVAIILMEIQTSWTVTWHPSRGEQILVGFSPALAMVLILILLSLIFDRRIARRKWEKQKILHLRKTADIDLAQITIEDELTDLRVKWSAFAKARETPNLFLLYVDEKFLTIPKRAFDALPDGPLQMDLFRALLMKSIAEVKLLPAKAAGFAVVPMAQVAEES